MSDEVKLEMVYTLFYSYYVLPFDYNELIIAKSACSKRPGFAVGSSGGIV